MSEKNYEAATKNVCLLDLSERCWLEVKGVDARKFLNGILTNNIQTLMGKTGCYAAICTPKGKMIADLFCYTCEDYFGIDCSAGLKPVVLETLKKYIIFQKVTLNDQSEKWGACGIVGPKAQAFLASKIAVLPAKEFEYDFVKWESFTLWVIRKKVWGLDGFEIWAHRNEIPLLCKEGVGGDSLLGGLLEIDKATQEILRIESATPLFGIDMDDNSIPQEAGLYSALSFSKGCYVGQEIVARLEHRGHVGKKLCQFKIEGDAVPTKGEKIFSSDGEEVGQITSACFSTKHNSVLALGYLRYTSCNLTEFLLKPPRRAHRL